MENAKLIELCQRYFTDSLEPAALQELLDYLRGVPDAEAFLEAMHGELMHRQYPVMSEEGQREKVLQRVLDARGPAGKVIRWKAYAAAAAVVLLAVTGMFLLVRQRKDEPIVKTQVAQDIKAPNIANVTITLGDGRKIVLDSVGNGALAMEGGSRLTKQADGSVMYEQAGEGAVVFNTVVVPKGSRTLRLTLSDGTKVWLNAYSSLRYPSTFQGQERRVEMNGEAYFEVAANKKMPFVVQKAHEGTEVQVLGTHFNVNAYDDEEKLKVTLLEGKVNVKKGASSVMLAPGQQAQVGTSGAVSLLRNVDTAMTVAWKNDLFSFRGVGLKAVMRQLSRWYNVDVRYEGDFPDMQFNGEIGRDVPLKDVLDGVALSRIHYRLEEGRRLVIMP